MKYIIGIDVGGSTTKIVGYGDDRKIVGMLQVKATDPLTSVYGAFGKFIREHQITLDDIERIILTGVGAPLFKEKGIYNIKTETVDEFIAIGLGGLELSQKDKALIVSMGTGTAYVLAGGETVEHIGGSGVGGGTLLGLCTQMIGARKFETIIEKSKGGDLSNTDLTISDISTGKITNLLPHTTASNFGKLKDTASDEDLALGVINMVFQTIGMLAVFALRKSNIKDVVLTGTLTVVPQIEEIFGQMEELYGIKFIVPDDAIFATAIGAALSCIKNLK